MTFTDRLVSPSFCSLLLAVLSFSMLQTMVVPALPELAVDLRASPADSSWVLSVFLLTSSAGTVLVGRLGDLRGRRRMMLVSLALLGLGTLISAVAGSLAVLLVGRAVQGLGAATFPLAFGLARELVAPERLAAAIGVIGSMFGIGFGLGLVVPGPIVDGWGWHGIFWVTLVVVTIAFAGVASTVPDSGQRAVGRVDWAGAVVLSVGIAGLLLAISQARTWPTATTVLVGLAALLVLAAFVVLQRRLRHPLVDLALLARRPVAAADVTALVFGFGMYGAFTLVPQLAETPDAAGYGFDASVTEAGLFLLPMAVTILLAGPVAGRMGERIGFKPVLVASCVIEVVGFAVLAVSTATAWSLAVGAALLGVGIGFAFSAMANVVVAAVERSQTGEATAINTIVRTIGGAVGAQVAAAVVAASGSRGGTSFPSASGYVTAFAVSAAAMVVAAIAASALPRRTAAAS